MRYELYRLIEGEWYIWGTYESVDVLARAACELGKMGVELVKVEEKPAVTTNLDRLRAMDAFDLADFLDNIARCCFDNARCGTEACEECPLKDACELEGDITEWLEQEVESNVD